MSKKELKKNFLNKLELFYRNFGNEWTLDDLVTNSLEKEYLAKYLKVFANKGIISLNEDGDSFVILDLPSIHPDL